jgi:hypothetical protein
MQLEECFLVVEVMDVPVVTIADLIAAGDQLGWIALRSATIPETWGVENDVPERIENPPASKGYAGELAANILTPGAAMSGCEAQRH